MNLLDDGDAREMNLLDRETNLLAVREMNLFKNLPPTPAVRLAVARLADVGFRSQKQVDLAAALVELIGGTTAGRVLSVEQAADIVGAEIQATRRALSRLIETRVVLVQQEASLGNPRLGAKVRARWLRLPGPRLVRLRTAADDGSSLKVDVPFQPSDLTRAMEAEIEEINRLNAAAGWADGDGCPINTDGYRCFSDDFGSGGRVYGSWTCAPSKELSRKTGRRRRQEQLRRSFTVEGRPVVELDFSALHPTMVMLARGISWEGDAYSWLGLDICDRDRMKALFQPAANSSDLSQAVAAARLELRGRTREWYVAAILSIRRRLGLTDTDWSLWRSLQRQDSDLAVAVCLRMVRQGVPCLPVHDSFIVPEDAADLLRQAMRDEFVGRFGAEPHIK